VSPFGDWYRQTPPLPLDDSTADRILAGKVSPDDAPPGYAGLAGLAEDLTVPAMATELAAETAVVEVMRVASAPHNPKIANRRTAVLAKRFTAKIAAIALVGTFGLGWAAAAAAGALPGQGGAAHHGRTGPSGGTVTANTPTAGTRSAPARTTAKPHTPPKPAQRTDPTVTTSPPSTVAGTKGGDEPGDSATENETDDESTSTTISTSTTMPTSTTTPSRECDNEESASTPAAACGDDDETTSTTMPTSTTTPSRECDDGEGPSTPSATCGEHESDQESSTTSTTVSPGPGGGGD
jgi:hypothetical protein